MLSSRRFLRCTMRYLHDCRNGLIVERWSRLGRPVYARKMQSLSFVADKEVKNNNEEDTIDADIMEIKDKIVYSEYLSRKYPKLGFTNSKVMQDKLNKIQQKRKVHEHLTSPTYSVMLQCLMDDKEKDAMTMDQSDPKPINMPYATIDKYESVDVNLVNTEALDVPEKHKGLNQQYQLLYEQYLVSNEKSSDLAKPIHSFSDYQSSHPLADDISKAPPDWMTDYEHYDDTKDEFGWEVNYGISDPNSEVSSVPCGGCGALLHCKDSALPGYLPSELFSKRSKWELQSMTCQRCHLMKNYNTSLAVNVSPDEYPKLLSTMKNKRAAVILLVDLMDFPCSIWPNILHIIGTKRPVFVVGNKVDLLPRDSSRFLDHVKERLEKAIEESGINKANIKHVALVSAKTGYGIEDLITQLHKIWEYQGHVYLVGCTNSGKSTLFNSLLQSDYCKESAVDRIQRATISPWPGTTLNLLKFPIMRPSPARLAQRFSRLTEETKTIHAMSKSREDALNETKNIKYAELIGHVGRSFAKKEEVVGADMYSMGSTLGRSHQNRFGIDVHNKLYKEARWCYDTPGTVQPDQVLHLLTTDELMMTLPQKMLIPRTFCIKPQQTLFVGGLGRLDYLEGYPFIRLTVFASANLPVTICSNADASIIYDKLLTTKAFAVPVNDTERLKLWPKLQNKTFSITGVAWDESAADVILSSAGWVAVTPGPERRITVRAWTPEGRGIYLRAPPLLRKSVALRGKKNRFSPSYQRGVPVHRKY